MFRKLLTFDEAKELIDETIKPAPLGKEESELLQAYGRVLAQDVISDLDIPPFSRATVDGYAVKAEDTFGADENTPAKLNVVGMICIGEAPTITLQKGEAVEIVTGAPIPAGVDAVIMMEDTEREDNVLSVYCSVTPNSNIMKGGTDIKKGEELLECGTVLGSREIGALAAIGKQTVTVFRVPIVAVLSTGGEVTEPGKTLLPGKIYDINSYSLYAAVQESGAQPVYIGTVPDDKATLQEALEKALSCADVVVTSGGVSIGPRDLTPCTVDALGKPGVFISGVAVKPGKPLTVALIGKKPVFSFPGHPTAALLLFTLIARPVIQLMGGKTPRELASIKAKAGRRMFSAKGRRTFVTVTIVLDEEKGIVAEPVDSGASGAITTLTKADGFVDIAENQQYVDAGQEVRVWLLKEKA